MLRSIAMRILLTIPTLLGVLLVTFFVIRAIPGDPAVLYLGETASREQIEAFREAKGLNEPLVVQMGVMLRDFAVGDLGTSFTQRRPVLEIIMERFPSTLELAVAGILFASVTGIFAGVAASIKRGKLADYSIVGASTVFMSVPSFLWALIITIIFGVKLGWIPVISISGGGGFRTLVAPALALGLGGAALFTRTTRSAMLEVKNEDYVRTARAKGLAEKRVVLLHTLKAAGTPVITIIGFYFASYMAGAIVVETIFARPGIGKMLIDAVFARDYAVVQGTTVFIAVIVVTMNLLTDIICMVIDPRIRIRNTQIRRRSYD